MKKYGLEVLAFIALVAGMWLYGAAMPKPINPITGAPQQTAPVEQEPKHTTATRAYIEEIPIEDKDAVALLGLTAFKWKIRLPSKAKSITYWIEDWSKPARQPKLSFFSTTGLNPQDTSASAQLITLLVKLPDKVDNTLRISENGSSTSGPQPQFVSDGWSQEYSTPSGVSTYRSPDREFAIGEGIFLTGKGLTGNRVFSSSLSQEEIDKNLRTVLLKMCINSTDDSFRPYWENGKVVLKKW